MTWLMTHMWIVVAAAGAVALLLGWSIRGMMLSGKMRQAMVERDMVKVELGNSKEEVEKLFAQIRKIQSGEVSASATSGDPILARKVESLTAELARKSAEIDALKAAATTAAPAAAKGGQVEDTLVWRNRHLESRVVHLEAELAKAQSAPVATPPAPEAAAPAADTAKLEWEVKYLRTRVEALQTELSAAPVAVPAIAEPVTVQPVAAASDPASPVEEEIARLRWRVRYLEGKLAYFEGDEEAAAEGEDAADAAAAPVAPPAPAKSAAETILGQLEAADEAADAEEDARAVERVRPSQLDKPFTDKADDLTLIGGIGPKIEELLHDLGIFHFEQIAEWSPENVAWVDEYLSFAGRITREGWVEQARVLAGEAAEA